MEMYLQLLLYLVCRTSPFTYPPLWICLSKLSLFLTPRSSFCIFFDHCLSSFPSYVVVLKKLSGLYFVSAHVIAVFLTPVIVVLGNPFLLFSFDLYQHFGQFGREEQFYVYCNLLSWSVFVVICTAFCTLYKPLPFFLDTCLLPV